MKRRFFSRTRSWPESAGDPARGIPGRERGSASLSVILLSVIFSGLGLAMLHASEVHMRINAFRKLSALLDCASENGVKRGLRDLAERLETSGRLAGVAAERLERFRAGPETEFLLLLEDAFGPVFPRVLEESFDGMTWESRAECGFESLSDQGAYVRITAGLRIEATGGLIQLRPRRLSTLEGSLGLLAGLLPLPALPLYIKKDMTDSEKAAFAGENGISFSRKPGQLIGSGLSASGGGILPDDPGPIVAKALNVGVFRPGDLSPAELREALGLEPSSDPVPEGVYLIRSDIGLGGVFVEGDLDEMILAIAGDTQIIVFRAGGLEWSLAFCPARGRTEFRTPGGTAAYDASLLPIVIVNGGIASLGGGAVGPDGRVELCFDGTTPAVLDGVDLAIVSADKVTLSSHLILEGVSWHNGIPYSRDSDAQLVIYSTGRDVVSGEAAGGGIAVAEAAPVDLRIQGSLTAASGGFAIEGTGKAVELLGALHADSYAGNGNTLAVARDDRAAAGRFPANAPHAATPQVAVTSLKVLSWKEY